MAVIGVVAVLLAALAFLTRVAWARSASTPTVVRSQATSALVSGHPSGSRMGASSGTTSAASSGTASAASSGTASAASRVKVHVVGQVHRPGVVLLQGGSRITDAVKAAGGALPRADLSAVNLARLVIDGEQVRIPKPGELVAAAPGGPSAGGTGPGSSGTGSGLAPPPGALVNINTSDLAALDTLPGVGPVLAQRILDWRTEHGRFSNVDELGEVSGIGEKMLAQLTPKVTV